MSLVKISQIYHAQCQVLLWVPNLPRVTLGVTGVVSEHCHGLVKKYHGKKNEITLAVTGAAVVVQIRLMMGVW